MSILIPGMEMRDTCYECPCNKDDGFGYYFCGVTKSECEWTKRPDDCPLVPVPEHGRLIDKDALERDISENVVFSGRERNAELIGANKIINRLHRAPTIIPAEEGEG